MCFATPKTEILSPIRDVEPVENLNENESEIEVKEEIFESSEQQASTGQTEQTPFLPEHQISGLSSTGGHNLDNVTHEKEKQNQNVVPDANQFYWPKTASEKSKSSSGNSRSSQVPSVCVSEDYLLVPPPSFLLI